MVREPYGTRDYDAALARLEDLLLTLSSERALPPVEEMVQRASLPPGFLREDDRARKVLLEAIAARPLSDVHEVVRVRTEVQLLTLEVEVLRDRLEDADAGEAAELVARLRDVRSRLDEVRALL